MTFQVVLRREGYVVLEATNASDAMEQIRDSEPDLLITELRLARMSGEELIRMIRADDAYNSLRIIALGSEAVRRDANAAGADDFQATPLAPEQLVRAVTALIGRA